MEIEDQIAWGRRWVEMSLAEVASAQGLIVRHTHWQQDHRGPWFLEVTLDRGRRRCVFTEAELEDLHSDDEQARARLRARLSAAVADG